MASSGMRPMAFLDQLRAHLAGREIAHFAGNPGRGMDAIGDGGDEHFVGVEAGP